MADEPVLADVTRDVGMKGQCFVFWCPGCRHGHFLDTGRWSWNGDLVRPTATPSILVGGKGDVPRCHLYIVDGTMQFLDDCSHEYKGQTVKMLPPWEAMMVGP